MATKKTEPVKTAAKTAPVKKTTAAAKSVPAKKAGVKPAAKKAAAKPAAKKSPAKKAAAKAAEVVVVVAEKKISPARAKAKAAHPVPERVPGRKERRGIVVSSAMDKTIVVRIDTVKKHERYGKVVRRSMKLHAHDEHNTAGVGDVVRVVETRPLSATKNWRLLEVLERAK